MTGERLEPLFGANVDPSVANFNKARVIARVADEAGLDLITIQDHPYIGRFFDTWTLIAFLAAQTRRVHVGPNVANLPLRGAVMLAKAAASLDLMTNGRVELGLGAGANPAAIAAMGGRRLTAGQAVAALGEAIRLMRAFWSGKSPLTFEGKYYRVTGVDAGPVPAHPIRIWTGNYRPKGLQQTGELADGWLPSSAYLPPEHVLERQKLIDEGAARAGRPPTAIRRGYNVMGVIDLGRPDTPGNLRRPGLIVGPPEHWVETLLSFYVDLRLDTFICWPVAGDEVVQVKAFAEQVVPAVKRALSF